MKEGGRLCWKVCSEKELIVSFKPFFLPCVGLLIGLGLSFEMCFSEEKMRALQRLFRTKYKCFCNSLIFIFVQSLNLN